MLSKETIKDYFKMFILHWE